MLRRISTSCFNRSRCLLLRKDSHHELIADFNKADKADFSSIKLDFHFRSLNWNYLGKIFIHLFSQVMFYQEKDGNIWKLVRSS